MRIGTRLTFLLAVCALAAAPAAQAQIYKWVDDSGVTNYTSAPPPNNSGKQLDEDTGRLSTIESYDYGPDLAATRNDALRDRVVRLEEELERGRRAAAAQDAAATEAYRQWREQCLAQRRTDCEEPDTLAFDEPGFVVAHPPKRRFVPPVPPHRPAPKEPLAAKLGSPKSPTLLSDEERPRGRLAR